MLFELGELEEIIETTLWTSMVADSVPVSVLLIGPSGTAKSALIKQYESEHIFASDSFTSQGLWDMLQPDASNKIRFLAVPDFNPTLSRKPTVVSSTIANLLTVTYDGSLRINDGRREKMCRHRPVGFISAVTPEIYRQQARRWLWLGIRRRIIPLFFHYSRETVGKLQDLTAKGKIHSALDGRKKISMPNTTFKVGIAERESLLIQSESVAFANLLGKWSQWDKTQKKSIWGATEIVPISPHLTLRTLARAHARRASRGSVSEEDILFLRKFLAYCDPETPRML